MSTLRERNRRRNKAEISEVALSLFEKQGYEQTTVEQIAAGAGISSATFFRYFAAKEDVLFKDEDDAAQQLVAVVQARADASQTLAALRTPVAEYANSFADGSVPRLTRLVMTTRTLEPRSLRLRLRWEAALAGHLAQERDQEQPDLAQSTLAAVAVSCLTSALRHWDYSSPTVGKIVADSFDSVLAEARA